jgi:tripartite-type tricarboxylate transporter receptor subunit TctC
MRIVQWIALALAVFAAPSAQAQPAVDFPAGTVRILVPFAAGGPTDVIMRILAERLGERWGKPVVVENRPGAGTIVATAAVAKALPDGHTLGVSTNSYIINPAINHNLSYDTLKDFSNVTMVVTQPLVLVAHPSFPAGTIPELVAAVKKSSEPVNFTSPGPRGSAHLAGELLKIRAGIAMTHISYNGSAPALTDVIAGRVPLMFDIWHSAKPHVEAGKLKVIAAIGPVRLPELPAVATIAETYPGVSAVAFQALFTSAGTPQPVVEKISTDVRAIVTSASFAEKVRPFGVTPQAMAPREIDAWVRSEIARWQQIVASANLKAE